MLDSTTVLLTDDNNALQLILSVLLLIKYNNYNILLNSLGGSTKVLLTTSDNVL